MEAVDTTRGYVMQQRSKERHTVGLYSVRLKMRLLPLILRLGQFLTHINATELTTKF
jgi:hypothetical protein